MALTAFLTGCLDGPIFMKQDRSAKNSTRNSGSSQTISTSSDESGAETASVKAGSIFAQEIVVSSESPVAGTKLSFPPGALAIDTEITIEEGQHQS
jgi:hypothetical protein